MITSKKVLFIRFKVRATSLIYVIGIVQGIIIMSRVQPAPTHRMFRFLKTFRNSHESFLNQLDNTHTMPLYANKYTFFFSRLVSFLPFIVSLTPTCACQ